MSSTVTSSVRGEIVLTVEQWTYLFRIGQAVERMRSRLNDSEPDTGDINPPTWENL